MNQGDIVFVPFPYTNLSATKSRPALIISKNTSSEDAILLAITSKENSLAFKIDKSDLEKGELPLTSYIKISRVVSLKKSLIRKRVAILEGSVCNEVIKKFKAQF